MNYLINQKHKFCLAILAVGLLLGSCEKKVLELEPYTSFSDVSAYSSPSRVELAVNGVYDAAQSGFYLGTAVRGYPFGAAYIEQGDMRGEDMWNQALFYQITYEATYNSVTANNSFMFQTLYSLINRANLTMEGIQDATSKSIITSEQSSVYEAECRFLRAMAHHELVLHFARPFADGNGSQQGVVYRDFGINTEAEIEQARSLQRETVGENYTRILADLDFAESNLPESPTSAAGPGNKAFRATKAAAIALKMRVKLHQGDWAGVIAEGNKLVPAGAGPYVSPIGGWKLEALGAAFVAPYQSDESIFSIKNADSDNGSVNGAMAAMFGDPAMSGRGLVRVSPILWSDPRWLCTDLRRSATMVSVVGSPEISAVYTVKYKDVTNRGDAAPQIRYAEVLLTLAEAEARSGSGVSARAVDLLNEVRNRAITTPVDQFTTGSFADANALIDAILFERRVEFAAEGKRWGDIHRLALDPNFAPIPGGGIPAKVATGIPLTGMLNCAGTTITKAIQAIPYSDFRFIWPIPIEEIQQNPNFAQNPGY